MNILNIISSILFGSLAGLLSPFFLERYKQKLSKDTEDYKTRLKLKEKILELKLDCLSALIDHKYRFFPPFDSPDKDWEEAQQEIIDNFGNTEGDIILICRKYLSVLKKADQEMIERLVSIASSGKFEIVMDESRAIYSENGRQYADEYFKKLGSLINSLQLELNI